MCIRDSSSSPSSSDGTLYINKSKTHKVAPVKYGFHSVSYTHLDVYKRQEDGTFSFKVQKVEQRKYEVKNYFMPLPYAELEKNKNLMNNQGWE